MKLRKFPDTTAIATPSHIPQICTAPKTHRCQVNWVLDDPWDQRDKLMSQEPDVIPQHGTHTDWYKETHAIYRRIAKCTWTSSTDLKAPVVGLLLWRSWRRKKGKGGRQDRGKLDFYLLQLLKFIVTERNKCEQQWFLNSSFFWQDVSKIHYSYRHLHLIQLPKTQSLCLTGDNERGDCVLRVQSYSGPETRKWKEWN